MEEYKSLIDSLREEADCVQAIEWEIPICTDNHIRQAADTIEALIKRVNELEESEDQNLKIIDRLIMERNEMKDFVAECAKKFKRLASAYDKAVGDIKKLIAAGGVNFCFRCSHIGEDGHCDTKCCPRSDEEWAWEYNPFREV